MKAVGVLCGAVLLSGCSALDEMALNGQQTRDPTKVYLATFDTVETNKREVDQFACLSDRPLICTSRGVSMECSCPPH